MRPEVLRVIVARVSTLKTYKGLKDSNLPF